MENKQNNKDSKSAQEILKKIQSESAQQKKNKAYQILLRKQKPIPTAKVATNYFEIAKKLYDKKYVQLMRRWSAPQSQRSFLLTGFLIVSTFICWRVEIKYDRIKKKASTTKTFKEAQIEKQNIEINKYLSRNEFESVPIREQPQMKNSYKFEETQGVFDTSEYLLEQIAKEYREGNEIDDQMVKELKSKGYI